MIEYLITDERTLSDPDDADVLESGEEPTKEDVLQAAKEFYAPCAVSFANADGSFTIFHHVV